MRRPGKVQPFRNLAYPHNVLRSKGGAVTSKAVLRDHINQITKPQLCLVFLKGDAKIVFRIEENKPTL